MKKIRIAISGINGFVGHHLARELVNNNVSVIGVGHDADLSSELNGIVDEYHSADLIENWPEVENVQGVIHLAGLAAVGPSFDNPQRYINGNSAMVTNLCEYYVNQSQKPRIVIVSSGAVYDSNQPMPITEESKMGYTSPYAVSKVLTENQAAYYRNRGLECVVARPFNHIGPGQDKGFILPDFYSRLSSLSEGEKVISVGNIETRRDYTDVRDIVHAYGKIALAPTLEHAVYNICSGESLSGADIFNELKAAMNLTDVSFKIDPSLVRPSDISEIIGDSSRLQNEVDWKPIHPIHQTIVDFVNSKTEQQALVIRAT
jgi:GDP-4-dehydro-6-deoxy-D-mannose reductase